MARNLLQKRPNSRTYWTTINQRKLLLIIEVPRLSQLFIFREHSSWCYRFSKRGCCSEFDTPQITGWGFEKPEFHQNVCYCAISYHYVADPSASQLKKHWKVDFDMKPACFKTYALASDIILGTDALFPISKTRCWENRDYLKHPFSC
jgi:hypothetical protein